MMMIHARFALLTVLVGFFLVAMPAPGRAQGPSVLMSPSSTKFVLTLTVKASLEETQIERTGTKTHFKIDYKPASITWMFSPWQVRNVFVNNPEKIARLQREVGKAIVSEAPEVEQRGQGLQSATLPAAGLF